MPPEAWGREKALHLFQFFITMRRRQLNKAEIIDRLWPELDGALGDRDFKVALNALNQALEPKRKPRTPPRFIQRFELTYGLNLSQIEVDVDVFERLIAAGHQALPQDIERAMEHYRAAVALYAGDYLPERQYEDWSAAERERLLTMALSTMTTLANLILEHNPLESLHLTQTVLARDPAWEDAYRIQMRAYMAQGNRAQALRSYQQCVQVLEQEFGVEPLPETQMLYQQLRAP